MAASPCALRGGVAAVPEVGPRGSFGGGVGLYEPVDSVPTALFGAHADVTGGPNHVWLRAGPEVIYSVYSGFRARPEFGLLAAKPEDSEELETRFYTGLNLAPRLMVFPMVQLEADVSGGAQVADGELRPAAHVGASVELLVPQLTGDR